MLPSLGIKNPIFELYGYGSVFHPCFLIFCMDGMAKVVLSYLCYKPILSFHQFLTGLGWPSGFVFVIRIRIQDLQLLLFSKYKQQQKTKFGLVVVWWFRHKFMRYRGHVVSVWTNWGAEFLQYLLFLIPILFSSFLPPSKF